jgi:RNA polymerase subunit RPABC4/transcription elongation factor Spt4
MSRLSKELSIIPTVARVVATFIYVGTAVGFWALFTFGPPANGAPPVARFLLIFLAGIPLAIYALLIGYVNADARRRGMRYIMWTLLAIFIPNAIGIIVYFILREPMPRKCPNCSQSVGADFAFCPHCGFNLLPACPNCKRAVEPSWRMCPTCGTSLTGQAPAASIPPPPYAGPQNA